MRIVLRVALLGTLAAGVGCSALAPREISDGERMYLSKCTACHAPYEPHQYSPQQWRDAVAEMETEKHLELSEGERALILGYLTGTPGVVPQAAALSSAR